jgi:16S rRNA processing protein RimM
VDQSEEHLSEDVVIARIVKARGIAGEVACDIDTDFPERFDSLQRVTVMMPGGERLALGIENHWFHKNRIILKFGGYDTMTAAGTLVGGILVIPESARMPLEDGQFYEYDIVGSEVVTVGGKRIGLVARLMRTGASDLLVVEGEDHRQHFIPFVDEICVEVDAAGKRIVVQPPEGLLEL